MKYLTVLLCLFLCYELSTQHHTRGFHPGRRMRGAELEDCAKSAGVTVDELDALESEEEQEKIMNGDGDYKKFGCLSACLLQYYGVMDGATFTGKRKPHHDGFMDQREKEFLQRIETCEETATGAGDECDVALAFEVCMLKSAPKEES